MMAVMETDRSLEQWQMEVKDLGLGMMNLPGYSPDFNADEAIRG